MIRTKIHLFTKAFFTLCLILFFGNIGIQQAQAQTEEKSEEVDIYSLSLEDLMNVDIVSASREKETAAEVPVSSFVISRQEILYSGATSIPEALRICPGLIVREIANGAYDVSLRGGNDGYPTHATSYANTTILVMINNRPVFSPFQGGTYWSNLPVGLAEINRIEVVHGPSSPLYGPNAVQGVINIITEDNNRQEQVYTQANAQLGSYTQTLSVVAGYDFSSQFGVSLAFNLDDRTRFNELFYDKRYQTRNPNDSSQVYQPVDSLFTDSDRASISKRYPDLSKSLQKTGGTATFYIKPSEDINLNLSTSFNQNIGLFPQNTGRAITNYTNESANIYLAGSIYGLNIQASLLNGIQGISGEQEEYKHNYRNTDLYLDYNIEAIASKLYIRPSISYQSAYANDKMNTVNKDKIGTFNDEGQIDNYAGALKIDYRPIESLRIIASGRYDQFTYPDEGVFSYQGIINYTIASNHMFRVVAGKSYNSSFLLPSLVELPSVVDTPPFKMSINLHGNKNLSLLSNTMYELGYRAKFGKSTILDIALFDQTFENFSQFILQTPTFDPAQNLLSFDFNMNNLPLKVNQQGVTLALQTNLLDEKLQIRPNITLQQTKGENYSPYYNVKGAYDQPSFGYTLQGSIDSTYNNDEQYTPAYFGGVNVIYRPIKKLTIGLSSYFYDNYTLHEISESNQQTGQITKQQGSDIKGKFLLNAVVSYEILKGFTLYANGRNLLDQQAPEGFGTDYIHAQYLFGLNFRY